LESKRINTWMLAAFERMVNGIEEEDKYMAGHSKRVAAMSEAIGKVLGLTSAESDNLRWAALVHDIGKIAVDPGILNKPGKLTYDEQRMVNLHSQIGSRIVEPVANGEIVEIIRCHHYRYDGGLDQPVKGAEIPLGARIVAVADSYEAMTSDRPYRSALSPEEAIKEIKRCAGTQFDPLVADAFLRSSES
jgi:putative two-component system response regulator